MEKLLLSVSFATLFSLHSLGASAHECNRNLPDANCSDKKVLHNSDSKTYGLAVNSKDNIQKNSADNSNDGSNDEPSLGGEDPPYNENMN